jgi:fructuronate reductase
MADAAATLPPLPGADLTQYRRALLARFRNPALRHRTAQIAMDGSQKLPQRWAATVRDRLARGLAIERFALGFAAWMRYASGRDDAGHPLELNDPLSDRLRAAATGRSDVAGIVQAFLAVREIFGTDLPADRRFVEPVQAALQGLVAKGARRTVAELARLAT